MFHIHPVDGLIGNLYWIGLIGVLFLQKKVDLKKSDFLILFGVYLLNTFLLLNQLSFETLIIKILKLFHYIVLFLLFCSTNFNFFLFIFSKNRFLRIFSKIFKYLFNDGCRNYFNCVLNKWNRF